MFTRGEQRYVAVMQLPSPAVLGEPTQPSHSGATWATVAISVAPAAATALRQCGAWEKGPLPVAFRLCEAPLVAHAGARATYFPSEVTSTLYGSSNADEQWSERWYRHLNASAHVPGNLTLHHLGVEHHMLSIEDLRVDAIILHLAIVPHQANNLGSDLDHDLDVLSRLLHPVRHSDMPFPPGLLEVLGVDYDIFGAALRVSDPWFTVLRTVREPEREAEVLRGAASGTSAAAARVSTGQLERLRVGRVFEPSDSWTCEVGTRGFGFARRLVNRERDRSFFDVASPAYVRSIYFDMVHLVLVQNLLLSQLRGKVVRTDLPRVGGPTQQYDSVLAIQRASALFRIRVWWTNIGRGSWPEQAFRLLQEDWDLRSRVNDLDAETSSLAELVDTVAEQEAQLYRNWSRRTSLMFSVLLGAVAALAVPQTLLAAFASGADPNQPKWLPGAAPVAQFSVYLSIAVLAWLPIAAIFALYWFVRAKRGLRSSATARR